MVLCWAVVVRRSATLVSDVIGAPGAAINVPTFVTPTRLAREAGVAVALGVLMRRFLLPSISCASFFGSVPSISCASFALRSFRPAECQLRSPTAAESLDVLACKASSKEAAVFLLSAILLSCRSKVRASCSGSPVTMRMVNREYVCGLTLRGKASGKRVCKAGSCECWRRPVRTGGPAEPQVHMYDSRTV